VRTIGSGPVRVELTDCAWTESHGTWAADVVGVQSRCSDPASAISVQFCDFSAPGLHSALRAWNTGEWTIAHCHFACGNGFEALLEPVHELTIETCRFQVEIAPIFAGLLDGDWDIGYCDFLDNEGGTRLVRFNDSRGGRVHHCKFTKTTGTYDAGNECLEGFGCSDIVFDTDWVTTCTEDAFEHVNPRGGCVVHDCVGDDVAGQVVDYFGNDPDNGGEIYDIFGTCHDVGVILTDVDNLLVHDIHTNNLQGTWYNVRLENRHSAPGLHPTNCTILPPLPDAADSYQGAIFGAVGLVGPDNHAEWWDDGVLDTWSSGAVRAPSGQIAQ
jgi:hypothetical protein